MPTSIVFAEKGARSGFRLTPDAVSIDAGANRLEGAKLETTRQNFIDRVRAYIPLEVLAFFIFVNSTVSDGVGPEILGDAAPARPTPWGAESLGAWFGALSADDWVALSSVAVSVVAIFLFVRTATGRTGRTAWVLQGLVSTVAFFVWIYAIRAEAFYVAGLHYYPSISGFLLGTFTLFSGFLVPVSASRDPKAPSPPPAAA
jgi:hypothetical protein